jgi:hypothetical protein
MQAATPMTQGVQSPVPIEAAERPATVQTHVWMQEHEWLYRLHKDPANIAPKFRMPDLLSACVSLVLGDPANEPQLVQALVTRLMPRAAHGPRRSCDVWAPQFDLLMAAHRAAWNRFPNPMFNLDQLASACVAMLAAHPHGDALVLEQARRNFLERFAGKDANGTP